MMINVNTTLRNNQCTEEKEEVKYEDSVISGCGGLVVLTITG